MYIQKHKVKNDIYTKKILLLNKLYYIITSQVWTYRNMENLDSLIQKFIELSDTIKKPKDELLLKTIRNKK
jgi:hypothetical protein